MSSRVDPSLLRELKEFGAVNVEACFNCGNCTAICPLTEDGHTFPRNMIRLVQMGIRNRLKGSPDPWLCYYCGDCSETCPREAEPGETMMALRRWLTAQYDWTGLARLFYTSKFWEVASIALVGGLVVLLAALLHGPIVTDRVELNTFAPVEFVHMCDWIMAGFLLFFMGTNILRMYLQICFGPGSPKIPIWVYLQQAWRLPYQFVTQERFSQCDDRTPWLRHLIIVAGYATMLVLIMFFLNWFQTDEIYPITHPQRWIGYLATLALIYGAGAAIWGRIRKSIQMQRFSHLSDWIFPILLLLGAVTGILVHAFRYLGWPLPTYYIYVTHLALMAPMLILEVPFGKWSHLAYRPLAIYFQRVRQQAEQLAAKAPAPAAAD
jgi:ferredoxin